MFVYVMCWLWAKSHSMLKNVSCTWDWQGPQTSRTSAVKPLEWSVGKGPPAGVPIRGASDEELLLLAADGC